MSYQYCLLSCPLSCVDTVTDLGVILSSDLSFSKHINQQYSKARGRSAIILKCFQSRDSQLLFRAFTVYVRPILEYCCNVWSPYRLGDIRKLESVQRQFTKKLGGLKDLAYSDRLKCLKADSLEMRRVKFDLSMYYNILHETVHFPSQTIFQVRDIRTRSNGLTLYKERLYCNSERYIFRNRQINIWNSLPQNVVSSDSLFLFNKRLNVLDLDSIIFKVHLSA